MKPQNPISLRSSQITNFKRSNRPFKRNEHCFSSTSGRRRPVVLANLSSSRLGKLTMDRILLNAFRQRNTYQIKKLALENPNIFRGRTLQDNTALHLAARLGDKHVIKLILRHEPSFLYERNQNNETPTHIAAKAGNASAIETFVEYFRMVSGSVAGQENILRMRDNQGNTPLHKAVRNHHNLAAVLLMNNDPETILLINDAKQSPLSIAIDISSNKFYNDISSIYIAWFIIKEHPSSLNYRGPNKLTLLHFAVIRQDYVLVVEILKRKRELINELDEPGRNPLHYAAVLGNEAIARRLLDAYDASSSLGYKASDSNGKTPFHLAVENDQKSFLIMLMSSYPDAIVALDGKQRNILHLAALNGNVGVVKLILTFSEMEDFINSPDMEGNTPLHLAAKNFHEEVVDVLSKNKKVDIMSTNRIQQTALAIVESSTNPEWDIQKQYLIVKILRAAITTRAFYPENTLQDDKRFRAMERDVSQIRHGENRKIARTLLVMATLMAAFTFKAAYTLPRGYEDEGMAKLVRKSTITVAMISSMTAAVLCLGQIYYGKYKSHTNVNLLHLAIPLIWLGLVSMSVAFVAGLFVVLTNNMTLAKVVLCIGCAFPFLLYYLGPFFFGLETDEIKLFQEVLSLSAGQRQFKLVGQFYLLKAELFYLLKSVMLHLYNMKYGLYTHTTLPLFPAKMVHPVLYTL